MVDRVLSELAEARGGITLVIDDLHELTSREALAQLARLLTDLPAHVHVILTTRHDLRLGLHQLRLAGELAEIRAADLRFTEGETRQLLAASGIALSEAGATLLYQRTEGWAAGLRLAAISLAGHPDPERFVAEFSGSERTVAEYLLAEMLDRQPPDVQDLLLRTSLLDRVNGELADLLTGRPGSDRILLDLADANAFVVPLDPERMWFRYHHLLADFLQLELRRTLAAEVPALHRRAAGWFLRQGQAVDAIRHTQAAGDWADAARLLADHSFSLMLDGQAQTMQALVRAFPPGEYHPELALVRAADDLVQGRLDESAAHLAVAETYAEAAPLDRRRRLQVAVASLQLSLARRRGDLAGVIEQVRFLASPVTGQSDEDIVLGSDLRAVALMNLGTAEAWSLGLERGRRAPPPGGCRPGPGDRPPLPGSRLPRAAGVRVEDPSLVRDHSAALPRGDSARRAVRLGHRAGDRARADHAGRHDDLDGRVRRRRAVAATNQAGPANRHRAGHHAPAAPDGWDTARLPRPPPRSARGVQRGRIPGIAASGIARAGEPGDPLDAGHPGPPRDARRGPRVARGAR